MKKYIWSAEKIVAKLHKKGKRRKEEDKMSVDLISLTKVNMVMEECRRLRQDIQRRNYPAINERVNHAISGLNLLRRDYVGDHGERNINVFRNKYQQFMDPIIQDNNLVGYYKVVRYLNKIHDDFMTIKDQLKQRPQWWTS